MERWMQRWWKTDHNPSLSISIADATDEITIVPEPSVTGDDSSPDVQHAVDGSPIYPALLAATTATADNNAPLAIAEDDNDTG